MIPDPCTPPRAARRQAAALLALLLWLVPAAAAQVPPRLQRFLDEVQTLRADFRQTVLDEQGERLQSSSGTMYLQRPDRFRWEYREPYPQLIVADGRRVWIYDRDLEQVTVRSLGEAVGSSPAQLLSSGRPLQESFRIEDQGEREGLAWIALEPRDADATFSRVRLGFDGGHLTAMELRDNFGQLTRVRFSAVETNLTLDPGLFEFTPPPGVDVIGDAGE